jgi:hypothetical protein
MTTALVAICIPYRETHRIGARARVWYRRRVGALYPHRSRGKVEGGQSIVSGESSLGMMCRCDILLATTRNPHCSVTSSTPCCSAVRKGRGASSRREGGRTGKMRFSEPPQRGGAANFFHSPSNKVSSPRSASSCARVKQAGIGPGAPLRPAGVHQRRAPCLSPDEDQPPPLFRWWRDPRQPPSLGPGRESL